VRALHRWDVSPREASQIQERLAEMRESPVDLSSPATIAGVDVSVRDGVSTAAVVVLSFPEFVILETAHAWQPTPFPYVPGLLSFREGPVILKAFEQIARMPDVAIFDGQGTAHPRRMGIARHIGLWLDMPTIGCAKSRLVGEHSGGLPIEKGTWEPLTHQGEVVGAVVRTRRNVRPVYVSPGHRTDLMAAIDLTLRCCTRYRLPEPIRAAHNAAGEPAESLSKKPSVGAGLVPALGTRKGCPYAPESGSIHTVPDTLLEKD
jgi:deoxyribonuclease V